MKQELLLFVEITPGCNRNSNSILADSRKVGFHALGKTIVTSCERTISSFVEVYVLSRSFDFIILSCELTVPTLQVPKTLSMVEQVPTRALSRGEYIRTLFVLVRWQVYARRAELPPSAATLLWHLRHDSGDRRQQHADIMGASIDYP